MARMVTMSSSKKGKGKKHKIRHMTITPAENGFLAETHYHPEMSGDGKEAGQYMEPETKVFNSPKDLSAHVSDCFGGNCGPMSGGKPMAKPAADTGADEDEDDE